MFGYEEDNNFEDGPPAKRPRREGGCSCEQPTRQLHTGAQGLGVEQIGDLLDR
jgi:hypothetical protein